MACDSYGLFRVDSDLVAHCDLSCRGDEYLHRRNADHRGRCRADSGTGFELYLPSARLCVVSGHFGHGATRVSLLHRSLLARGVLLLHLLRDLPTALFSVGGVGERDPLCPFLVYPRLLYMRFGRWYRKEL